VKHLKLLGLCLIAALLVSAGAVSNALAVKTPTKALGIYRNCPTNAHAENGQEVELCIFGATELGEKGASAGGSFTVGPITVPIEKQIKLQYGLVENEKGEETSIVPTDGAPAIEPTPENVPGEPIGHITAAEQEELGWPSGLKYSYAQAQKKGQVKHATETIEIAGVPNTSRSNLIEGKGTAVEAPVMIKAGNAWLSAIGVVCTIGSEEHPIVQHLTSGNSVSPLTGETAHGESGELSIFYGGAALAITKSVLVDNTYAVPGAVCTGPYASQITATIDKEFSIPQPAGASTTVIKGTLYSAAARFLEQRGI